MVLHRICASAEGKETKLMMVSQWKAAPMLMGVEDRKQVLGNR